MPVRKINRNIYSKSNAHKKADQDNRRLDQVLQSEYHRYDTAMNLTDTRYRFRAAEFLKLRGKDNSTTRKAQKQLALEARRGLKTLIKDDLFEVRDDKLEETESGLTVLLRMQNLTPVDSLLSLHTGTYTIDYGALTKARRIENEKHNLFRRQITAHGPEAVEEHKQTHIEQLPKTQEHLRHKFNALLKRWDDHDTANPAVPGPLGPLFGNMQRHSESAEISTQDNNPFTAVEEEKERADNRSIYDIIVQMNKWHLKPQRRRTFDKDYKLSQEDVKSTQTPSVSSGSDKGRASAKKPSSGASISEGKTRYQPLCSTNEGRASAKTPRPGPASNDSVVSSKKPGPASNGSVVSSKTPARAQSTTKRPIGTRLSAIAGEVYDLSTSDLTISTKDNKGSEQSKPQVKRRETWTRSEPGEETAVSRKGLRRNTIGSPADAKITYADSGSSLNRTLSKPLKKLDKTEEKPGATVQNDKLEKTDKPGNSGVKTDRNETLDKSDKTGAVRPKVKAHPTSDVTDYLTAQQHKVEGEDLSKHILHHKFNRPHDENNPVTAREKEVALKLLREIKRAIFLKYQEITWLASRGTFHTNRVQIEHVMKAIAVLNLNKEDILKANGLSEKDVISPVEILNCGYLRLTPRNIQEMEELARSQGQDVAFHLHLTESKLTVRLDEKFQPKVVQGVEDAIKLEQQKRAALPAGSQQEHLKASKWEGFLKRIKLMNDELEHALH